MQLKQWCVVIVIFAALVAALPSVAAAKRPWNSGKGSLREHVVLDMKLWWLLRLEGIEDADYLKASAEQIELGNLLFYDKILSGNEDISCATCHHALMATGDGLSLSTGVGGHGLATARAMGAGRGRVPRNAPEIFNRGHEFFTSMFWDSRVARDEDDPTGFAQPAGSDLPLGFEHPLEVQAMFPLTSPDEMRGNPGENEIANAGSNPEIWDGLEARVMAIPEYQTLIAAAFPGVAADDIGCEHIARAIAAFEADAWRSDDSPFDRYLRGNRDAMSASAKRGALLFYGRAGCGDCHSGVFQ
ncbi:MAG: cytochrome-c peroxidase, partial [Deltaproteobacteria bacterium]|nr:cytochrome-c peroxidase [Deltaproteobacteria bacterium]